MFAEKTTAHNAIDSIKNSTSQLIDITKVRQDKLLSYLKEKNIINNDEYIRASSVLKRHSSR